MPARFTLDELNAMSAAEFIRQIGPVFENSPWIAERAAARRPFSNGDALLAGLWQTVTKSQPAEQLALMRAHPDLVGRAAQAGQLGAASTAEQSAAGLDALAAAEVKLFQTQNAAYQAKFGFPFIICARLNKKSAILEGFSLRLRHTPAEEHQAALDEIYKIATLRLRDLLQESLPCPAN